MGQVHWGICEFGLLLWPYKHAKKTEANQNRTDAGPDPQDTLWYVYLRNASSNIHYHKIVSARGGWHLKGIN